jgi:hypothetical protein
MSQAVSLVWEPHEHHAIHLQSSTEEDYGVHRTWTTDGMLVCHKHLTHASGCDPGAHPFFPQLKERRPLSTVLT